MRKASASVSPYVLHQYSLSLRCLSRPCQSLAVDDDGERKHRFLLLWAPPSLCGRVLADERSLTTLEFEENATYKARSSFSKAAVEALMSRWNLNALFVPDLLGRPNYWSPELYSSSNSGDSPDAVGKSSFLMP